MACFAKQCVAREEAALRGIGDALQRIRNEEDGEVDTQCDEVVAICCHHIASVYGIYGTEAVIAIQWLCNPQHDQTPESVAAFVEDEGLNETLQWFRLHYSKKMLQYMKTIDPQDTIIVNNPKKPTPPGDPKHNEVAGSAVLESTHNSITLQSGTIPENISVGHDPDECSIPEHNINSLPESDSNDTTLLLAGNYPLQQARTREIPSPQALPKNGCNAISDTPLNANFQRIEGYGPADTDQLDSVARTKLSQSHRPFPKPTPALYCPSNEINTKFKRLPLIQDSKTGSLECLQRTLRDDHMYYGSSNTHDNRPMSTLLPDHRFDGETASRTAGLEGWAVVSKERKERVSNGSRTPLWPWRLPPLRNRTWGQRQPQGPVSRPFSTKCVPLTDASAQRFTCASISTNSGQYPESGAGKASTLKKHSSHTRIVTPEAQSSRGNPSLNTLAEKSWPRLLPGDLMTNLGMVHAQRADSWMANFGQDIASYRSGNLYHCPFGDGKYRTPYHFLRHLMDGHSASRLLKTYDAHNQLALICGPKM